MGILIKLVVRRKQLVYMVLHDPAVFVFVIFTSKGTEHEFSFIVLGCLKELESIKEESASMSGNLIMSFLLKIVFGDSWVDILIFLREYVLLCNCVNLKCYSHYNWISGNLVAYKSMYISGIDLLCVTNHKNL